MQRRGDGWIATGWLALLALLFAGWLAVAPLPAQFGDLVGDFLELDGNMLWNGVEIDAVNTGEGEQPFAGCAVTVMWSGVGLADAAYDLLTGRHEHDVGDLSDGHDAGDIHCRRSGRPRARAGRHGHLSRDVRLGICGGWGRRLFVLDSDRSAIRYGRARWRWKCVS